MTVVTSRAGVLVLAAAALASVSGQTGGNQYTSDPAHVGSDGGICVCPDGQEYEVGDNLNGCASLACVGGHAGACSKGGISAKNAGMKVVCEVENVPCLQANVAYVNADGSFPKTASGGFVMRAEICQSTCKGLVGCTHFTWVEKTRGCYLMGTTAVQKSIVGVTSGPEDCNNLDPFAGAPEVPTTPPPTEAPAESEVSTPAPTAVPAEEPTPAPTAASTEVPTPAPTAAPSEEPTASPTAAAIPPIASPVEVPTLAPTAAPVEVTTPPPTAAPAPPPTDTPAETEVAATTLAQDVEAQATELQVASEDNFQVGMDMVIAGGGHEETRTITGFGSIVLSSPLEYSYPAGSKIVAKAPATPTEAPRTHGRLGGKVGRPRDWSWATWFFIAIGVALLAFLIMCCLVVRNRRMQDDSDDSASASSFSPGKPQPRAGGAVARPRAVRVAKTPESPSAADQDPAPQTPTKVRIGGSSRSPSVERGLGRSPGSPERALLRHPGSAQGSAASLTPQRRGRSPRPTYREMSPGFRAMGPPRGTAFSYYPSVQALEHRAPSPEADHRRLLARQPLQH